LENKSKAETFIGFAIRTGKFRIGTNAVQTLKRAYLMIVCSTASQNTKEQAEKIAKKFHCQLIETASTTLEQLTHRENAKVMAIADKNLSVAILENMEKDFIARI
jgi:ribosomal protein L30E